MVNQISMEKVDAAQRPPADVLRALTQADQLFHRVGRSIPVDQKILSFLPELPAREAVRHLKENFYSQAPVAVGRKVLGVFSFRSFALKAAEYSLDSLNAHRHAPGDLTVEECMERFNFVSLSDELVLHFDALERDNGVLVGTAENLIAILTPMDVLRYLLATGLPSGRREHPCQNCDVDFLRRGEVKPGGTLLDRYYCGKPISWLSHLAPPVVHYFEEIFGHPPD